MSGTVVGIYIASASAAQPAACQSAALEAGQGIVGDRYFGQGIDDQVTLVDADAIDEVNAATGWALEPQDTRRNIVTRGVDLNQWESSQFRIGSALLEGVELCEPCAVLGKILATEQRSAPEVVRVLTHKVGLRARVIEGGEIHAGDPVAPA